MSGETPLTLVGNLTADPEIRWTQSGTPVAAFTIASTPRTFDKQRNEWVDGEPLFVRCDVWQDMAENVAESLEKGARVIATGWLRPNNFTDKEGNQRTGYRLDVQEVGPALRYATARPVKANRRQNAQQAQGTAQGGYSGQQSYGAQDQRYAPQGGAQPSELGYDQPPPF